MEAHERIGVVPVAARAMAPIDHHDVDFGVCDQFVGERHAGSASADHQVVGLENRHAEIPCSVASSGASASHPDPSHGYPPGPESRNYSGISRSLGNPLAVGAVDGGGLSSSRNISPHRATWAAYGTTGCSDLDHSRCGSVSGLA